MSEQHWSRAVPVQSPEGEVMMLVLDADQRSTFERFCWELMGRVSASLFEAMLKAAEYVVHGLNGARLGDDFGLPYHELIAVFRPEHRDRLVPADEECRRWWWIDGIPAPKQSESYRAEWTP